jgi:pimeloyl-ACP methyl ester carboxylesterase
LVLGAQDDRMVPTEMAARYAELIPAARLVTVEGPKDELSGHALHIELPDEVAGLIAKHVAANV